MADFQGQYEQLTNRSVRVYAISTDSRADAQKTVERHGLEFAVAYDVDLEKAVSKTGAYADREKGHLQATSFILWNGTLKHATYSTGPLGRLQAEHVAMFVDHASTED